MKRLLLSASAICGAAVIQSAPAMAQLDEIVVTAQSREQGLQDTPISISAVPAEKITGAAIQKSEDLQYLVPNFTMTETGIATNLFIRGIGSGINQAFEQSVATYIDGVHYPRAQQTRAPFMDLERVEVLRGPQAILFGKNAIAGALNITTAKPTEEFEGYLSGSYEFEDEEYIFEGAVSGPLSDKVRMRASGRYRSSDGYVENLTLGRSEPQRDDWLFRWQGEFDLSENLQALFKAEVGEFDVVGRHIEVIGEQPSIAPGPLNGLTYAQILAGAFGADPSVLNTTFDGARSSNGDYSNNKTQTYVANFTWDSASGYEVRSTTAYEKFKYDELCDCDFTGAVVFDALLQEQYDQISSELRVTSPVYDHFDFVAGLYWQTSDHDYADQIAVPANSILVPAINLQAPGFGNLVSGTQAARLATTNSDLYSAFAQVKIRPMDNVELQLGGRLSHEKKEGTRTLSIVDLDFEPLSMAQFAAPLVYANLFGITSTNLSSLGGAGAFFIGQLGALPVADSLKETRFSPDVKLVVNATDDILLYASWARGYKTGGFDFRANNKNFYSTLQDSFKFDDEQATNYEIGGKIGIGNSAELNFAAFFTKFDDLQISIFDGVLGFNVGNAASAEIKGVEFDSRWAPNEYLTLSAAGAYTDFEFTDFENGQCYFGQTPDSTVIPGLCSYTGNSNQLVSKFQGVASADIHFPVMSGYELSSVTDVFYTSKYDASSTYDPGLVQDAYATLNSRVAFGPEDGSWQLAFLAKNITDKQVLLYGGDTPLAGSTFGAKSNYSFFSQGRTLWVQGRVNF
ncbi:MAG: TonB-dependent receptor [Parvularculaceae bacterium]